MGLTLMRAKKLRAGENRCIYSGARGGGGDLAYSARFEEEKPPKTAPAHSHKPGNVAIVFLLNLPKLDR